MNSGGRSQIQTTSSRSDRPHLADDFRAKLAIISGWVADVSKILVRPFRRAEKGTGHE